MTTTVVASRYARALIDVLAPDHMDAGLEQLRAFAKVLENEDSRKLLMNPAIPPERRDAFINALAESIGFDLRVKKLLSLIVERRRLRVLDSVIFTYQGLLDERHGIARAIIKVAAPLSENNREAIVKRLEKVTGKRVEMEVERDDSLIGGVVVQIGSTVYDGSLKQQLLGFKHRVLAE